MRVFKSTYKAKDGKTKRTRKWYIEMADHFQIVRRFAAFTDKAQSELLARKIEKLVAYRIAGEGPDPDLSHWIEHIPARLRDRLVAIGLLERRRAGGITESCGWHE